MATHKSIHATDIQITRSALNQLVDIIQQDVSGTLTRRKYVNMVTGGVGPGVTSSMFQTVYDQDYTLQTANPVMDITVGLASASLTVQNAKTGEDASGKMLFQSSSLMMREKVSVYRQFAQTLLGDADERFWLPWGSTVDSALWETGGKSVNWPIQEAAFFCYKRLFARDSIKQQTFAMKVYSSASHTFTATGTKKPNLAQTSESGSIIVTDVGSTTSFMSSFAGPVGNLVTSRSPSEYVGLIFYDKGIIVTDLGGERTYAGNPGSSPGHQYGAGIISGSQRVSGTIDAMNAATNDGVAGKMLIGASSAQVLRGANSGAKFVPDLMVSASIDDIVDHLASCRFSSGSLTAMTYQNITQINSTLIFCRAAAGEFNYSSNPTFIDSDNNIVVIEPSMAPGGLQRSKTFITSVCLEDVNGIALAIAKLSRPVEKNDEKDLTIRVRLDF